MALHFLAELSDGSEWEAIHEMSRPAIGPLDVFPIPRILLGERDAIGISVKSESDVRLTVECLRDLFTDLWREFDATIFNLYTGDYVDEDSLEATLEMIGP
jgi:hypothetical protein